MWDRHEPRPTSIAAPRTLEAPRAPSVPLNSNRPESLGSLRPNRPHYFPEPDRSTFDNMLLHHNPYSAEVVDKGAGSDLVQRCVSIAVPL